MNFDADELELAWYFATVEMSRLRRKSPQSITEGMRRYISRLDLAIRCMSSPGHEIDRDAAPLKPEDLIGTREAGHILNRSPRQTRRLKDELGARIIGDRLQFPRNAVESYAQERTTP